MDEIVPQPELAKHTSMWAVKSALDQLPLFGEILIPSNLYRRARAAGLAVITAAEDIAGYAEAHGDTPLADNPDMLEGGMMTNRGYN